MTTLAEARAQLRAVKFPAKPSTSDTETRRAFQALVTAMELTLGLVTGGAEDVSVRSMMTSTVIPRNLVTDSEVMARIWMGV